MTAKTPSFLTATEHFYGEARRQSIREDTRNHGIYCRRDESNFLGYFRLLSVLAPRKSWQKSWQNRCPTQAYSVLLSPIHGCEVSAVTCCAITESY
jgi:hypothetical protein